MSEKVVTKEHIRLEALRNVKLAGEVAEAALEAVQEAEEATEKVSGDFDAFKTDTENKGIPTFKYVTQSEYDALPDSKKSDGVLYLISDAEE